jgi:SAM-dependent methyltransferase
MSETTHSLSASRDQYRQERIDHWNAAARQLHRWRTWNGSYHRRLAETYRFLVPPGSRVLEIGCGAGDLLAALEPSLGVGVDFSGEMVRLAQERHPHLHVYQMDAQDLSLDEAGPFDAIILSDAVNELWDVQGVFEHLRQFCSPSTRIILNYYSRLWELPLGLARKFGLATPNLQQNWLTPEDVKNLLYLAGFEVIRGWGEILLPLNIPLLAPLFNKVLARLALFRPLTLTNFTLARPRPGGALPSPEPLVSVIVPARNESGNIHAIFERMPEMGAGTEIVFVEGHSKDDTYAAIEAAMREFPQRRAKLFQQTGAGKGDAVRLGFAQASGEVLMICDADLTVPPEDLPRFYEALVTGKGELINGVRLVYPMDPNAMRFFNILGNKFFSLAFTWMLGQPIKDTLCGTKVLSASHYASIAANRAYFGQLDPFGDYDLIFGAARLNLKIVDLPIRYRERTYGATNIQRWKHGWLLMRMVALAARRLKFI